MTQATKRFEQPSNLVAESSWKLGQDRWAAPESLLLKVGPLSQMEWIRSRVDGCTSCTVAGG